MGLLFGPNKMLTMARFGPRALSLTRAVKCSYFTFSTPVPPVFLIAKNYQNDGSAEANQNASGTADYLKN